MLPWPDRIACNETITNQSPVANQLDDGIGGTLSIGISEKEFPSSEPTGTASGPNVMDINRLMIDEVFVSPDRHTGTNPMQVELMSAALSIEITDLPDQEMTDDDHLCDPL
jgi:hypothetical protein